MPTVVIRYVNTASSAGGDGTTNATSGANRAWVSLNEALGGLNTAYGSGLVAADVQVDLVCSGATDDTVAISNAWPTSDTTRYIHLQVPTADRKVAWDGNVYTKAHSASFSPAFIVATNTLRMTGIQILHAGALNVAGNHGIQVNSLGGELVLDGVKIFKQQNAGINGISVGATAGTYVFRNVIISGFVFRFASGVVFSATPSNSTVIIYNHTHHGGTNSIDITFAAASSNTVARVKNALLQSVTNNLAITNATTSDTATNSHATTTTAAFTDATNGDFTLTGSDTVAIDQGTNLSAVGSAQWQFNVDANGNARNFGGVWDLGAHEYGSTAPPGVGGARSSIPAIIGA